MSLDTAGGRRQELALHNVAQDMAIYNVAQDMAMIM